MSRASHQTATTDFNALHDQPDKLAQAMVQHRSEPFYLSEIVQLAGAQINTLETHQSDIWKDAKKAHDQIQKGRAAAKETNTAMLIEQMQSLGWNNAGAEALVSELFNENRSKSDKYRELFVPNKALLVIGEVNTSEDKPKIFPQEIMPLEDAPKKYTKQVHFRLHTAQDLQRHKKLRGHRSRGCGAGAPAHPGRKSQRHSHGMASRRPPLHHH